MKASNSLWREQPIESPFPELMREIEIYETEIELRKQGKMDEKLFAETRLRRGAYGQRYDNGQRWDGKETQTLPFPSSATELTKGVNTVWDAPGMQRIKVPFGGMNPEQLEVWQNWQRNIQTGLHTSRPGRIFSCTLSMSTIRPLSCVVWPPWELPLAKPAGIPSAM
jgi:hypothetical protein